MLSIILPRHHTGFYDFSMVLDLFLKDSVFIKLWNDLNENFNYYFNLSFYEVVKEIKFRLYKCNVSCRESGLCFESDFNAFAQFILNVVCNIKAE